MPFEEPEMTIAASIILTVPVTSRDHLRGPVSAEVTLVEYGDYACARCNQARLVVKQLQAALGNRLRYVFRNFPMSQLHSNYAAEAAEAAGAQNKFWEMHDVLYDHQSALSDKHLKVYATWVGLDMERFKEDMAYHTHAVRVREDALAAKRSGVSDTPAFFINDSRHLGPPDFEALLSGIGEAS
jgi:protein-disulfide isomerase